jgi:septal ring factor EnvC (AmiA/AmiB activator)
MNTMSLSWAVLGGSMLLSLLLVLTLVWQSLRLSGRQEEIRRLQAVKAFGQQTLAQQELEFNALRAELRSAQTEIRTLEKHLADTRALSCAQLNALQALEETLEARNQQINQHQGRYIRLFLQHEELRDALQKGTAPAGGIDR